MLRNNPAYTHTHTHTHTHFEGEKKKAVKKFLRYRLFLAMEFKAMNRSRP